MAPRVLSWLKPKRKETPDRRLTHKATAHGQMKMNEVAGVGNWNTAEFWEYGTREIGRKNPDPVRRPWESPYAVFGGNPIVRNDVKGDDWYKGKDGSAHYEVGRLKKSEMKDKDYIKRLGKDFAGNTESGAGVNGDESGHLSFSHNLDEVKISAQRSEANKQANVDDMFRRANTGGYGPSRDPKNNVAFFGALVAPLVAAEAGALGLFSVSTELAGIKAGLSWGSQALINGVGEVDYADVAGDAFTAPGLNALWGSGVDWKPFSKDVPLRIQGIYNTKSLGQFGTDAAIGFGFGMLGELAWKPLSPMLRTPSERSIYYLSTQIGISVGQQGTGKVISDNQEQKQ